jgi:pyruvate,water dikinase
VLTTAAYNAFVEAHGLQQQIVDLAHTVAADDPHSSEVASEKIKQLFLGADVPADIVDELMAANDDLGQGPVAVRSSATAEDLEDASFAGQQETFLNVQGKEALLDAVKKCWASLWSARAITYRIKQEIAPSDVSLAAVVQKQIESEVSGIGFSLNPNNNCYDEAIINASFGLGEAIVSGVVTPDTYVVDKVEKSILSKEVNEKKIGMWRSANGGIEERPNKDPKSQALTDAQILAVAELISKVEAHYHVPMDIEWALEAGTLYLLQARPITTHFQVFSEMLTKPGERKILYTDLIGTTQGFSEPFSVLGLDLWAIMMDRLGAQGSLPAGEGGLLVNLHGRQYDNVSNMLKAFGRKTATEIVNHSDPSLREQWDTLVPEYIAPKTTPVMRSARRAMAKVGAGYAWPTTKMLFGDAMKEAGECARLLEENIVALKALKNDKPLDELIDEGFDTMVPIWDKMLAYIPAQMAKRRIDKMFEGMGLDDELAAMGAELASNPTGQMGKAMFALACEPEFKRTESADEFVQRISERAYSPSFLEMYDAYMYSFGDRGIREIDIATPRLRDNPAEFYRRLAAINTEDSQMTRTAERKVAAYQRLREEADKMGKREQFDQDAEVYEGLAGMRETPKYLVVILTGMLRGFAMVDAAKFVKQGRLEQAEQVFDLHLTDLVAAQKDESLPLLPLVEANTAIMKKYAHVKNWPTTFDSRGKIIRVQRKGKEGELVGTAISNGVIQGRAKVLTSPYEKPVDPGEILVTHATEPSWTPVFINAAGVVLEVGGPLQHGAIIAREYGIPCVSGLDNATTAIKDGDMLEVDGTNGIVKVVEPA